MMMQRARELDPALGEAYLAEAFVAEWDRETGITDHTDEHLIALTEKALALSPNNPRALKMLSSLLDDPERKLDLIIRAARIDPRSGIIGMKTFGFSAPYKVLDEKLGFTPENVYKQALVYLVEFKRMA